MCHKNPILCWICLIAVLIGGLISLAVGLMPFGINVLAYEIFRNPQIVTAIQYLALATGIILIVKFVYKAFLCSDECPTKHGQGPNRPYGS